MQTVIPKKSATVAAEREKEKMNEDWRSRSVRDEVVGWDREKRKREEREREKENNPRGRI